MSHHFTKSGVPVGEAEGRTDKRTDRTMLFNLKKVWDKLGRYVVEREIERVQNVSTHTQ